MAEDAAAATVSISILFTDVADADESFAEMGAGPADDLRSTYFGVLRGAVASSGGTEVKNLGNGLMVAFSSVGGALTGAVAMQQALESHNRDVQGCPGLRIGLSTGDATSVDGDYFGEPIVEAARLCSAAHSGQILTTRLVALLARRLDHQFNALGAVELKGLPEPTEIAELVWEPAIVEVRVPLPTRLSATPAAGLAGRHAEREQLAAAMKAVRSGNGHRLVFIAGEPGIGKTTLASDLAQCAHSEGALVLYGRCDEELAVPYQPFVEAIGELVAELSSAALATIDHTHLSELSRLVPEIRLRDPALVAPPSTDPETERFMLFSAVTATLSSVAASAMVVIVLDDLHWADKPTVLLLRHLVARLEESAVLLIGTYRDSDVTAAHPLSEGLAALQREPSVDRVRLAGLDDRSVIDLLEGMAGHEMGADGVALAHAVRRETGGNPFFTAEVLRHLADTGAIREESGRWVAAVEPSQLTLPDSVREVVGQRVRRLGPNAQHVLTLASVIGRDFDLSLLARLADDNEDDVLEVLEKASATEVVNEVSGRTGRFTFSHALFQHTLYGDLSASRRARTHRRIGELLELDCGDDPGDRIGELARHWIAATAPMDVPKAGEYACRAGSRALAALAPDEAIRWFSQALEILDVSTGGDPVQRLDALIGLGDAQRQGGDPAHRETLLAAAAEADRLGETDRLVAASLANLRGTMSTVGQVDVERTTMLERALSAVGDAASSDRAWLLAALAAELIFDSDPGRVRPLALEAQAMARRIGDDVTLLRVLNLTFLPLWLPDGLEHSLSTSSEAQAVAERSTDRVDQFQAATNRILMMATSTNRAAMEAAFAAADLLESQIGQHYLSWQISYLHCLIALVGGDHEGAERLADQALQISSDSGQPDSIVIYGANLAGIRFHQGRLEEILPLIEQAVADNPGLPGFQAAHAMMLCECGDLDAARPLFAAAAAADFHNAAYDYVWLTTTALWADTAAWLQDEPAAELLYERLAPFEAQGVMSGPTFVGTVGMSLARLAGVLGRVDDAVAHFERADRQLRSFGAPFFLARNQLEWARLLLARDADQDRASARDLVRKALSSAQTWGCAVVEARAAELLACSRLSDLAE